MSKKITYTKLTAKIIVLTLVISLSVAFIYAEYMKENAIKKLASVDAKKSSKLVFQTLYAAMERGWTRDDVTTIIGRINNIEEGMEVAVYRSEAVSLLFGEQSEDKIKRESDADVKQAFLKKEDILKINDDSMIRYYYPLIATNKCLACHTNISIGDTLGVIDIKYPITDLKISLSDMINFFIVFVIVFSILIFFILFLEFDRYLLKPIKSFASRIKTISEEKDISKRVELKDDIEEIHSMQLIFNNMLDSIEYQFYYDELTKLPNRKKLLEELSSREFSILTILNIDSFQEINDLYGDSIGDIILIKVAKVIKESLSDDCILYKLHADEYAIHCKKSFDLEQMISLVTHLVESISKYKFEIKKRNEIFINITAGVSHGEKSLLSNADIALKLAKKRKKKYLLFDASMDAEHEYSQNIKWTKKIKKAIEQDRIVPLFQPIVDTKTGKTVKYESLIRMVDVNGEYISPIHFLELAKKNKLYHSLTEIMIKKSFEKFKNIDAQFSINLSVDDILNKDVENLIYQTLQEYDSTQKVVFEIIESEGIENFEEVIDFINNVKKFGCKISIDDFGTGYSNFEYLMKLKVDFIKIDASMIKSIDVDRNSELVTETIIDFAKKMNMKTVAEYVHSKNVYEKIKEIGIDYAQGYYLGEPKELE